MKRILIILPMVVLIAAGCNSPQANIENGNIQESSDSQQQASTSPGAGQTREFTVVGGNFTFDLKEIRVKEGDTVKIMFRNDEGFHDWVVDEFSAKTPVIQKGQSAEVTFVASKKGTFEYYCSVGQHRQMGMKGNLIVE